MDDFGVGPMSVDVFDALSYLTPYDIDRPKVRVGAARDGGYVLADIPSKRDLFSFGIANDVRFEKQMAESGHRCFMFDHTINALPDNHANFSFYKIGIRGSTPQDDTLSLEQHLIRVPNAEPLILKIDVEGAEWDVFSSSGDNLLSRFEQIVGEFHWLHELGDLNFREKFITSMKRLTNQFTLFHVHANNCRKLAVIDGFMVADVLELSFIRNDLVNRQPSTQIYPTSLDQANNAIVHDHALLFYPFLPMAAGGIDIREVVTKINNQRVR
jgi:hypothetical protein